MFLNIYVFYLFKSYCLWPTYNWISNKLIWLWWWQYSYSIWKFGGVQTLKTDPLIALLSSALVIWQNSKLRTDFQRFADYIHNVYNLCKINFLPMRKRSRLFIWGDVYMTKFITTSTIKTIFLQILKKKFWNYSENKYWIKIYGKQTV